MAELVQNKEHLNAEGLNKIIKIVEGMNLDRKLESSAPFGGRTSPSGGCSIEK